MRRLSWTLKKKILLWVLRDFNQKNNGSVPDNKIALYLFIVYYCIIVVLYHSQFVQLINKS